MYWQPTTWLVVSLVSTLQFTVSTTQSLVITVYRVLLVSADNTRECQSTVKEECQSILYLLILYFTYIKYSFHQVFYSFIFLRVVIVLKSRGGTLLISAIIF